MNKEEYGYDPSKPGAKYAARITDKEEIRAVIKHNTNNLLKTMTFLEDNPMFEGSLKVDTAADGKKTTTPIWRFEDTPHKENTDEANK